MHVKKDRLPVQQEQGQPVLMVRSKRSIQLVSANTRAVSTSSACQQIKALWKEFLYVPASTGNAIEIPKRVYFK